MATAYSIYTSDAKTAVTLAEAKISEYESLKGICVADLDAQDEFKMQVLGSLQTIAGIATPAVSAVTGIPPAYVDTGFGILFGLLGGTAAAIAQSNRSYAKGLAKGKTPA
jgi:hypothetical protein